MKKFLSCFSVILCVLMMAVGLVACNNTNKWITPEISIDSQGYTVESITNADGDFTFPINCETLHLDHSKYEQGMLEYSWIIYNASHEIVGWIETGNGYDIDKKGNYKYGFSRGLNSSVILVLKSTDLSVFDNLTITANYGTISMPEDLDANPQRASKRYTYYDEASNTMKGCEGSASFVYCYYELNFDGVNMDKINSVQITITPSSADFLG